jgi:plastocyanin
MAISDSKQFSLVAGATFAEADLYRAVGVDSSGHAVLYNAAAGATGGQGVVGTLYSVTSTTGSAGNEAVTIGDGPLVKAFMAGSTVSAGDLVTFSTDDGHCVVATTNPPYGVVTVGSSGTTGRIFTVKKF